MAKLTHLDILHWPWTAVTFVGSLFLSWYLLMVAVITGFRSVQLNWLAGLSFTASLLLLFGTACFRWKSAAARICLLAGSAYFPLLLVFFSPPPDTLSASRMIFLTDVIEMAMASYQLFFQDRTPKLGPPDFLEPRSGRRGGE
ncbi:hypothetical protein [Granulicella pectinivorans]|uniref:hypothetical protein n=1 Tax=Granulicella pectinivorans TaxID=474950 RepID=UPI000B7F3E9B|nr:hypothetical protein [Granulicella pectinivorans]